MAMGSHWSGSATTTAETTLPPSFMPKLGAGLAALGDGDNVVDGAGHKKGRTPLPLPSDRKRSPAEMVLNAASEIALKRE